MSVIVVKVSLTWIDTILYFVLLLWARHAYCILYHLGSFCYFLKHLQVRQFSDMEGYRTFLCITFKDRHAYYIVCLFRLACHLFEAFASLSNDFVFSLCCFQLMNSCMRHYKENNYVHLNIKKNNQIDININKR